MTGHSGVTRSISAQGTLFWIDVDNISNEVGSVKNVSSQFFVFLSTPVYLRSCGFGDCSLAFLLPSVSRSPGRLGPFASSFRCCPPDISSVLADHDEFFELPAPRGWEEDFTRSIRTERH